MPSKIEFISITGFGRTDRRIHNKEARDATKDLFKLCEDFGKELQLLVIFSETLPSLVEIMHLLHRRGINFRYLGRVREAVSMKKLLESPQVSL
jgi:hypothetical protein